VTVTGWELVLVVLAAGVVLWWAEERVPLLPPMLLGVGVSLFFWGFVFGWWPLAILGFAVLGAWSFVRERRLWAEQRRAADEFEARLRDRSRS
jgi:hypothetical protein